jgi:hypothetical protein
MKLSNLLIYTTTTTTISGRSTEFIKATMIRDYATGKKKEKKSLADRRDPLIVIQAGRDVRASAAASRGEKTKQRERNFNAAHDTTWVKTPASRARPPSSCFVAGVVWWWSRGVCRPRRRPRAVVPASHQQWPRSKFWRPRRSFRQGATQT